MKKRSFLLAALAVFGVIFSSCEIGLGGAVDTEPPVVTFDAPEPDSRVRGAFTASGEWSDDVGLASIKLDLKNISTSASYGPFDAMQNKENELKGTWTCTINPSEASISDGTYLATITATDTYEHSVTATATFSIDNTAPVIVLTSPSTKDISNPTSYGQVFSIEGKAADDSDVDSVDVILYDESGNEVERKTISNVSTQIDATVAQWGDDVYKVIYGDNQEAGDKKYYIGVTAYDGARQVPALAGDRGNSTDKFYFSNDLENLSGFKTTIAYHLLDGTTASAGDYEGWKEFLAGKENNRATISLNPVNNPYFDVQGYEPFGSSVNFNQEGSPYDFMNKSKVTVNIYVGRDKKAIKTETIGIYLKKCDANGNVYDGDNSKTVTLLAPGSNTNSITAVGSTSYKWTSDKLDVATVQGLETGSCYIFDVVATDYNGNSIRPDNNGNRYGIKITTTTVAPVISITSIGGSSSQLSSISIASSEAFGVVGHVTFAAISASGSKEKLQVFLNAASDVITNLDTSLETSAITFTEDTTKSTESQKYYDFTFTVPKDVSKDSSFTINLIATDAGGTSSSKEINVSNDTEAPVFEDFTISPYVDVTTGGVTIKKVNGIVNIQQLVSDNNVVNDTWYSIDEGKNWTNLGKTTSMSFAIDTVAAFDEKDGVKVTSGKLPVYLKAVDKAGNENISKDTLILHIDQTTDAPEIELSNCVANDETLLNTASRTSFSDDDLAKAKKSATKFRTMSGNQILGSIKDDDGIASVKVYICPGTTWEESKKFELPLSTTPQNNPTTYNLTATLLDKDNKELSEGCYLVQVVVKDKYADYNHDSTKDNYYPDTGYNTAKLGPYLIALDNGAPELSISTASGSEQFRGGTFSISGTMNDQKADVKVYSDALCKTEVADSVVKITMGDWNDTGKIYNWTAEIDAGSEAATKTYYFHATDEFGQSTTKEYTFSVDPNPPRFKITSLQGEETVAYPYKGDLGEGKSYTAVNKYGNRKDYFTVKGEITDSWDSSQSSTSISNPSTYMYYYVSTSELKLSEGEKSYKPATVSNSAITTKDGWNTCTIKQSTTDATKYSWEAPINFSNYKEGDNLYIYFASLDNAGNYTIAEDNPSSILTVKIDGKMPEIKGNATLSQDTTKTTIDVLAKDGESGINNLAVTRNGKDFSLTNATVEVGETDTEGYTKYTFQIVAKDLTAGENKFVVKVTDNAGNSSSSSEVVINNNAPTFSDQFSGIPENAYVSGGYSYVIKAFEASGKVSVDKEGNKLGSVTWKDTYKDADEKEQNLNSGDLIVGDDGKITINSPLANTTKTITDYEGKKVTRTITATNIYGQSANWTYNFIFDTKAPELVTGKDTSGGKETPYTSIGGIDVGEVGKTWFNTETLKVAGRYNEDGSGVDVITYSLTDGNETAVQTDASIYTSDKGDYETFDSNIGGFTEGKNTLAWTVKDKAGNVTSQVATYSVKVDTSAPTLIGTVAPGADANSTEAKIWYRYEGDQTWTKYDNSITTNLKKGIEFAGKYNDVSKTGSSYLQSGVKSLDITVNGNAISGKIYSNASGSWVDSDFAVISESENDRNGEYPLTNYWHATVSTEAMSGLSGKTSSSFTIKVADASGNSLSKEVNIAIDTEAPKFGEEATVTPYVSISNGKTTVNGKVTIQQSVSDNNAVNDTWYCIGEPESDADWVNVGKTSSMSFEVDTVAAKAKVNASGDLNIYLRAVDKAGNEENTAATKKPLILHVDQTTDAPEITLSNCKVDEKTLLSEHCDDTNKNAFKTDDLATAKKSLTIFRTTSGNQILGSVRDDDGIASVEVYLCPGTTWDDTNKIKLLSENLSNNPTTYNLTANLKKSDGSALDEGCYLVKVVIKDKYDGDSSYTKTGYSTKELGPYLIAMDNGAPEMNISTASGSGQFKSGTFSIKGTMNDKDAEFKAYTDKGCTSEVSDKVIKIEKGAWNDTSKCHNWTAEIDAGSEAGTKTYYFRATDEFGQSTTKEYVFSVDPIPPRFKITSLQGEETVAYPYKGDLGEGKSYTAVNKYGNRKDYFTVKGEITDSWDSSQSSTSISNPSTYMYYYVSTSELKLSEGEKSYKPATVSNSAITTKDGWNTCTIKQSTTDATKYSWEAPINFSNYKEGDNLYIYFASLDNAGNYTIAEDNPSSILTVKIDGKMPEIKGNATLSQDTTKTTIDVLAKDGESGINNLAVTRNGKDFSLTNATVEVGETDTEGYTKYTFQIVAKDLTAGENKFVVKVTDNAGNSSSSSEVVINNNAPTFSDQFSGIPENAYVSGGYSYVIKAFEASGKVSVDKEGNKLGSVTWKDTYKDADEKEQNLNSGDLIVGDDGKITINSPLANTTKTITDYEGKKVTRTITATNIYGQSANWTYNFIFDTKAPELVTGKDTSGGKETPYTSIGGIDVGEVGKTWFNTETLKVAGRYNEDGSGVDVITYSLTDGNETAVQTDASIYTSDKGDYETFDSNIGGFTEGKAANVLKWTAKDKAGNPTSELSYNVKVDTTAPVLSEMAAPGAVSGSETSQLWYRYAAGDGEAAADWKKYDTSIITNLTKDIEIVGYYSDAKKVGEVEYLQSGVKSLEISVNNTKFTGQIYSLADGTTWSTSDFAVISSETDSRNGEYPLENYWYAKVAASVMSGVSGTKTAKITLSDNAGNTNESYSFNINVDTTQPEVSIKSPTETSGTSSLDGNQTISGEVKETNPKSVALYYRTVEPSTTSGASSVAGKTVADPGAESSGWTLYKKITTESGTNSDTITYGADASSIYNWSFADVDFNSLSTAASSASAGYKYDIWWCVYTEDAAGNSNSDTNKYTVDMDADRPVIQLMNNVTLKKGENDMSSANRIGIESNSLSISVSDDDGIKTVKYRIDTVASGTDGNETTTVGEWKTATSSGTSYTIPLGEDGKKNINFEITDSAGTVFTTSTSTTYGVSGNPEVAILKTPKITDGTNNYGYFDSSSATTTKATEIYAIVDTTAPYVLPAEFIITDATGKENTDAEWNSSIVTTSFGGTKNRYLKLRQFAWDSNGISSASLKIEGVGNPITFEKTTDTKISLVEGMKKAETFESWVSSSAIDVKNFSTGTKTCILTVSDGTKTTQTTILLVIDNTPPTVDITSPAESDDPVYGSVVVRGSTEAGATLYYTLTLDGEKKPSNGGLSFSTWSGYDYNETTGEKTSKTGEPLETVTGASSNTVTADDYNLIMGTGLGWAVYFDGNNSDTLRTHTKQLINYLTDYNVTTSESLNKTEGAFASIVNMYLWIKAEDSVGNVTEKPFLIKLDPQGGRPKVTIEYPESDESDNKIDSLGGTIKLYGLAEDLEEGVDSVWLQILSDVHRTVNESSSVSGSYEFPAKKDESTTFGTFNNDTTTSNAVTSFTVTADDLDYWAKAGFTVQKMKKNEAGSHEDWVIGTTNVSDADAATYGIKADFSGSTWSKKINLKNEFIPVGTNEIAHLALRVYAYDGEKLSYPKAKKFNIDNDRPYITNVKLKQYDANGSVTATKDYSENVCVKGDWYLTFDAMDNSKVSDVKIKVGNGTTNSVFDYFDSSSTDSCKKVKYALETGAANSVGSLEITVTVEDDSDHDKEETYKIKYDNKAPKIATKNNSNYALKPKVQQSNGFYTLKSFVSDAETSASPSGIDSVAFYFLRRDSKDNAEGKKGRIHDPMLVRIGSVEIGSAVTLGSKTSVTNGDVVYSEGLYWKAMKVTTNSFDNYSFRITASDANIHKGGICKIGGTNYKITNIDTAGATITLDGEPDSSSTVAYFALAMVVDNTVAEFADGSKSTDDGYYKKPGNDDGDRMIEVLDGTSVEATWEAQIVSRNIPDGPIEIHYVAFDKAGNYSIGIVGNKPWETYKTYGSPEAEEVKDNTLPSNSTANFVYAYDQNNVAYVSNNAPRLVGVQIGTDFNGDNDIDDEGEKITKYYSSNEGKPADVISNFIVSSVVDQSNAKNGRGVFTLKNDSEIRLEIIGGNGALYYEYHISDPSGSGDSTKANYLAPADITDYVKDTILTNNALKGTDGSALLGTEAFDEYYDADGYVDEKKIVTGAVKFTTETLQAKEWSSKENPTWFTIRIWDSTEGTDPFEDSQYATLQIALANQTKDETPPNISVDPFYWNSQEDNSLYNNSYKNGHIDLSQDLVEANNKNWEAGNYVDPKVSGKISFRGTALDDHNLSEIWAKFAGITCSNPVESKNADDGYYLVAKKGADGTWTCAGSALTDVSSGNWKFNVTGGEYSEDGQLVNWQLDIDTSAMSGGFGADKKLEMMVRDASYSATSEDKTKHQSSATATSGVTPGYQKYSAREYNVPYYQVDVVPYISGIQDESGADATRSRLGRYPVRAGATIKIVGFNFGSDEPTVYRSLTDSDGGANETSTDSTLSVTEKSTTSITVNVPAYSGYIRVVWVTGDVAVSTPNNSNSNTKYNITEGFNASAENADGKVDYGRTNANKAGTNFWTDDVYLSVWNVGTNLIGSINPTSGVVKKISDKNSGSATGSTTNGDGVGGGAFYNQAGTNSNLRISSNQHDRYFSAWSSNDLKIYGYLSTVGSKDNVISKNSEASFQAPGVDQMDYVIVNGMPYYVMQDNFVGGDSASVWGPGLFLSREGMNFDMSKFQKGNTIEESDTFAIIERQGSSGAAANRNSSNGYDSVMYQFKNPRIAGTYVGSEKMKYANASTFATGVDYIYVSYYDSYARCLKFAGFKVAHNIDKDNMTELYKWGNVAEYCGINPIVHSAPNKSNTYNNVSESNHMTDGKTVVAGFDTTVSNPTQFKEEAGEWSDIMVDSTGTTPIPVIIYYNKTNKCLEIARGKQSFPIHDGNVVTSSSAGSDNTEGTTGWTKSTIKPSGAGDFGRYVSAAMDEAGNIHASAVDATKNKVYYLYITKSGESYSIASSAVIGTTSGCWTDIELTNGGISTGATSADSTTKPKEVQPVISWISKGDLDSTEAVQVSYLADSDTGGTVWETMTDPAVYAANDQRTSVMADVYEGKDSSDTEKSTKAKIAVGFNSNMYAIDFLRGEK